MDELTRLRAYFALQQLERMMGPADPPRFQLICEREERRTSERLGRLRLIAGGRR